MPATAPARRYRDTWIDVKVVLSALWATTLIVLAYTDVLRAALDGRVTTMGLVMDQVFPGLRTGYVLVPAIMVILALVLPARVGRVVSAWVALVYAASVVVSAAGDPWAVVLVASAVELGLLGAIIGLAWAWPRSAVRPGEGA